MSNMTPEMLAMLNQIEEVGTDDSVASKGGGGEDFLAPAGKNVKARMVTYIELGQHEGEWQGKKKVNDKVLFEFELSGKGYEPREHDGKFYPYIVGITVNKSSNEGAAFFKIFTRCRNNTDKQMAQLIGRAFMLDLEHSEPNKNGKVYCNIVKTDKCPNIKPATAQILNDDGDVVDVPVPVADAITPLTLFVWKFATPAAWDSLFIDGEWAAKTDDAGKVIKEAESKNKHQIMIKKALNFKGSPIADYALGKVGETDTADLAGALPDTSSKPPRVDPPLTAGAEDLMAGIG